MSKSKPCVYKKVTRAPTTTFSGSALAIIPIDYDLPIGITNGININSPRELIAKGFAIDCNRDLAIKGDKFVSVASIVWVRRVNNIAVTIINPGMAAARAEMLNGHSPEGIACNAPSLLDPPPAIAWRGLEAINSCGTHGLAPRVMNAIDMMARAIAPASPDR